MIRGRKPKPSYLRVLEGHKSNSAPREQEPEPSGDLAAPPHWLNERQKEIWRYALQQAPPGLLKLLDASIFTTWVVASDMHAEAVQKVNKLGQMVKSPVSKTPMQNPYVGIMNKQATLMMKAASEMGFTPSSRTRVKVDPKKKSDASDVYGDLKTLE